MAILRKLTRIKNIYMNKIIICLIAFIFSVSLSAQEKAGTYHLTYYQEDFDVIIDNLKARYKGYTPRKSERPQIYFEVKCEEDDVRAFIMLNQFDIKWLKSNMEILAKRFAEWSEESPLSEELIIDNAEVDLFFIRTRPYGRIDIGYESGLDYSVFFARDDNDTPYIEYRGESASNEGIIDFKIKGWSLKICDPEKEILEINAALDKATERMESEDFVYSPDEVSVYYSKSNKVNKEYDDDEQFLKALE
jgi:hypothetical protein